MAIAKWKSVLLVIIEVIQMTPNVRAEGPYRTACTRTAILSSDEDMALKNHVIATIMATSQMACSHACLKNSKCKSINVQLLADQDGRHLCELNNATGSTNPRDLQPCKGFFHYYDPVQNPPCESYPCLNGGNCLNSGTSGVYVCQCTGSFAGKRCHIRMRSCKGWLDQGFTKNGKYVIDPDDHGDIHVHCDQVTNGGGWIVLQRRQDGSVNFHRNWDEYKMGFGTSREFWLGNKYIHRLTQFPSQLRIDLKDFSGNSSYAVYSSFSISSEGDKYRLSVAGYKGNAGDSLAFDRLSGTKPEKHLHNKRQFTTQDSDNDKNPKSNCAGADNGGWWFSFCMDANLNGPYKGLNTTLGIVWWQWKKSYESLQFSEMKLRKL